MDLRPGILPERLALTGMSFSGYGATNGCRYVAERLESSSSMRVRFASMNVSGSLVPASSSRRTLILRSDEEKHQPERTWARPDVEFFCAGACHVLCGVFLRAEIGRTYSAHMIVPAAGMRGVHVFASDGEIAFDAYGLQPASAFRADYEQAGKMTNPSWTYSVVTISVDPLSDTFCELYSHRRPKDFPHDVISRATAFLNDVIH